MNKVEVDKSKEIPSMDSSKKITGLKMEGTQENLGSDVTISSIPGMDSIADSNFTQKEDLHPNSQKNIDISHGNRDLRKGDIPQEAFAKKKEELSKENTNTEDTSMEIQIKPTPRPPFHQKKTDVSIFKPGFSSTEKDISTPRDENISHYDNKFIEQNNVKDETILDHVTGKQIEELSKESNTQGMDAENVIDNVHRRLSKVVQRIEILPKMLESEKPEDSENI